MLDPILSLALSIYSNKGVYALLLGSGISRSAGVPTGWEIVAELAHKIALMQGVDCGSDQLAWYESTFGEKADYSRLLDRLAATPAERSALLRQYFEPSGDERARGVKVATRAHRAIATLVADGYIKVILTTNFDRLLESAIDAAGVVPVVISTADQVAGALPLAHSRCTIIKLHGDYLDSRIKNTPTELASYDPAMDRLLDRVFDEYGLLVSGWSAEWDIALGAAIFRCPTRRFSTFWTRHDRITDAARRLIDFRAAQTVQIDSADAFFEDLAEKVRALADVEVHPVSAKVGAALVKNYVGSEKNTIRLHDLVMHETDTLLSQISRDVDPPVWTPEDLHRRMESYESRADVLTHMFAAGCYWSSEQELSVWIKCLSRLADLGLAEGRSTGRTFRRYPALLLLYVGGIAALASERYSTFATLLMGMERGRSKSGYSPTILRLSTKSVLTPELGRMLGEAKSSPAPLSEHLFWRLREVLREALPEDEHYELTFDRFEYLVALIHADEHEKRQGYAATPVGRFVRKSTPEGEEGIAQLVDAEISASGQTWPLLPQGLFEGSLDRLRATKRQVDRIALDESLW